MNRITAIALLAITAGLSNADTTQTGPHSYTVDEGVTFSFTAQTTDAFLISWTDSSGTFTQIADPTLTLSSGQTYVFRMMTIDHTLCITDDTLAVSGDDGSYVREENPIWPTVLQPNSDFIAHLDMSISWAVTGDDTGDYYYTSPVIVFTDMTGKIIIEAPASCPADLNGDGVLNFFDVSAFLGAYTASDPAADFTGDGVFNFFDVSAFLTAFSTGCP